MAQAVCFSSDTIGRHTQVLTLDGDCDSPAALEAERRILAALGAGRNEIIFDLRGVASIDTPMLNALFRGLIRSSAKDGTLLLIRPNAGVWTAFELSGFDQVFPTSLDLKEALVGVSRKSDDQAMTDGRETVASSELQKGRSG